MRIDSRESLLQQGMPFPVESTVKGRGICIGHVTLTRRFGLSVVLQTNFIVLMAIDPAAPVMRLVHRDPVNPGPQAALPAERVDVPEHFQKHFLHNIARVRWIGHQPQRQVKDRCLKAVD